MRHYAGTPGQTQITSRACPIHADSHWAKALAAEIVSEAHDSTSGEGRCCGLELVPGPSAEAKKKLKKEKEGNVCQLSEGWGYTAEMKKKHIDARECTFRLHV